MSLPVIRSDDPQRGVLDRRRVHVDAEARSRGHARGPVKSCADRLEDAVLERLGRHGLLEERCSPEGLQLRCDGGLEVQVVKRDVLPAERKSRRGKNSLEATVPGSQAYRDDRQRAFLEEIDEAFATVVPPKDEFSA